MARAVCLCAVPAALAACAATLAGADAARAGAFYIGEHGARATGNAGAAVAAVGDPAAAFYNPAGIALLDGVQLSLGSGLLLPSISYTAGGTTVQNQEQLFVAPHGFFTFEPAEGYGVGLAVTAPFGLGVRWPEGSPGRFAVNQQSLRTLYISPVVAADASEYLSGLSLGAGLDVVLGDAFLSRDLAIGDAEGSSRLGGTAVGVGFRLGLLYSPSWLPGARAAVSGFGPVSLTFRGKVDFDAPVDVRSALPPDGTAAAHLQLPPAVTFGLAYDIGSWVTLEVDGSWFGWSLVEAIRVELPDGSTSSLPKPWSDGFTLRAGVTAGFWWLKVRAGYSFDLSPVGPDALDPSLPDMDRHLVGGGVGLALPFGLDVDAAVLTVIPSTRTSTSPLLPATYGLSAWVAELTVGVRFGGGDEPAAQPVPDAGGEADEADGAPAGADPAPAPEKAGDTPEAAPAPAGGPS